VEEGAEACCGYAVSRAEERRRARLRLRSTGVTEGPTQVLVASSSSVLPCKRGRKRAADTQFRRGGRGLWLRGSIELVDELAQAVPEGRVLVDSETELAMLYVLVRRTRRPESRMAGLTRSPGA
jgi:hypothetical protein